MPVNITPWEAKIGRTAVPGQSRQKVHDTPQPPKITTAKWTGGVAHVVECLLCKREALSSKPSPIKKKKKKSISKKVLKLSEKSTI
jgi:hypothetical protein